jgi:hypothetical protein
VYPRQQFINHEYNVMAVFTSRKDVLKGSREMMVVAY